MGAEVQVKEGALGVCPACVMDMNPSPMLGVPSPSDDGVPLGTSNSIAWVIT